MIPLSARGTGYGVLRDTRYVRHPVVMFADQPLKPGDPVRGFRIWFRTSRPLPTNAKGGINGYVDPYEATSDPIGVGNARPGRWCYVGDFSADPEDVGRTSHLVHLGIVVHDRRHRSGYLPVNARLRRQPSLAPNAPGVPFWREIGCPP